MLAEPTPGPARPEELADALGLIFRHLDEAERARRVGQALALAARGEFDPRGVLVLREHGRLAGAILCEPVPGAGGLVFPPGVCDGPGRPAGEDALVRQACTWLRQGGARLAQALLAPEEEALAGPLLRNGFARVTILWYLRHDPQTSARWPEAPPRLRFHPYDPEDPEEFHGTLARTYEDTLDCPEVSGVRTIEQVVEGYRAQGRYDPARWWLAREAGSPVGVAIVTALSGCGDWEVGYMGLVPPARGRGLGRELLGKALGEARAAGARHVTLSVDARNGPAWRLYRGMGFEPFARRAVLLSVWG
jgi:mycothiol synthase